ncbi:hypothetical protein HFO55_01415 [Rhizobium leguminosarum]|uniref:hypothetical protein n=1 Tax=Rhizobium TaxID=379 RepID=UPI001C9717C8|nr:MULTISPECIES: hypothetical protein [Rhizobium]MBY5565920.1 hypothetical protein [Rhizobium leguminosarum]MBY5573100.1 hypothetical protein [Rhizobium leguminosarum]UFW64422.1 hypothetical protein RlegWSM1455_23525 [Rhizobium laguerreae]
MTVAKNLYGSEKTDVVRTSFQNKISYMQQVYRSWKKAGRRGQEFWPATLVALKSWHDPDGGYHEWSSNNITTKNGNYSDLVDAFWELIDNAALIPADGEDGPELRRLKRENKRLALQVSTLTWQIMDYRDEIVRIDPNNTFLKATPFPPTTPMGVDTDPGDWPRMRTSK